MLCWRRYTHLKLTRITSDSEERQALRWRKLRNKEQQSWDTAPIETGSLGTCSLEVKFQGASVVAEGAELIQPYHGSTATWSQWIVMNDHLDQTYTTPADCT